jgi:hypothetical protein
MEYQTLVWYQHHQFLVSIQILDEFLHLLQLMHDHRHHADADADADIDGVGAVVMMKDYCLCLA